MTNTIFVANEFRYPRECLASDVPFGYCIETATVDTSTVTADIPFQYASIQDGTILGKNTSTGEVGPLDLTATNGMQTVYGVSLSLYGPGPVISSSVIEVLVRGPAAVFEVRLGYPSSATDAQITSINTALVNAGIQLISK